MARTRARAMMNLRLDLREEALKPAVDGKIPIVPGKPEQSEIIRRIFSTDAIRNHAAGIRAQDSDPGAKGNHSAMGGGGRQI